MKLGRCRASEFMEEGKGAPMSKGMAVLSLLAMMAWSTLATPTSAEPIAQETGHFADLIEQLSGRDYVLGSPARDDRPYVDPAPVLHAFRHLASAMAWGDVHAAARKAAELGYEVIQFTDVETKHEYYVLREDLAVTKTIRGWGSYIVNPNSKVDALIEVPHPLADIHTPEIGGQIFVECEARGYLLAGSHREKADVPDLVDSIFHQVHTAWIGPLAQVTAWQIHGFAGNKHQFPRGTQVVASNGDGLIVPEIAALDTMLEERGMTSYVFNQLPAEDDGNKLVNGEVPGVTFTSLAAAKNEQGRLSRSLGGAFVHIELERDVRLNDERRRQAGSTIALVMTSDPRGVDQASGKVRLASAEVEIAPSELATPASIEAEPVVVAASVDATADMRVAAKPIGEEPLSEASSAAVLPYASLEDEANSLEPDTDLAAGPAAESVRTKLKGNSRSQKSRVASQPEGQG